MLVSTHHITKRVFIIGLLLIAGFGLFIQCKVIGHDHSPRAEGKIIAKSYTVPLIDSLNYNRSFWLYDTATYLFKDDFIYKKRIKFSKSGGPTGSGKDSGKVRMDLNFAMNGFIIDLRKKTITYLDSVDMPKNERKLSEVGATDNLLSALTGYPFKMNLISLDTLNPVERNGKYYFRGTAVVDSSAKDDAGNQVIFECSKEPLPVYSPLNYYIPGVKYDITRLALGMKNFNNEYKYWAISEIVSSEKMTIKDPRLNRHQ
jgi:hypothetical protein